MIARLHGNGFIQLDLGDGQRLHIWPSPMVVPQKTHTPIHNHRFSFESQVLVGKLLNRPYEILEGVAPTHQVYEVAARDREDTKLQPTGRRVQARLGYEEEYPAGYSYRFRGGAFHESWPCEFTITRMRKTDEFPITPCVLVGLGEKPDNDFNRYEEKWQHFVNEQVQKAIVALAKGSVWPVTRS